MKFISWEISVIALIPAIFLCGYIYYKDKIEKEPLGFLLILFALGGISYIPTLSLEKFVTNIIDMLFSGMITYSPDGMISYSSNLMMILHNAVNAFIGVGLIEILIKWLLLFFSTYKNSHFDYLFDGIVYSVFISLGFAGVENLRFAWVNGWDTLALRLISSLPCHLIVGIIMGYYYTLWNAYKKAMYTEEYFVSQGIISEGRIAYPTIKIVQSVLIPWIVVSLCILAGSINSKLINTLFYFTVFCMYGFSFVGIERISAKDKSTAKFSEKILQEMHPETEPSIWKSLNEK